MTTSNLIPIILFAGFNEVSLPEGAQLQEIEVQGYEVTLHFKSEGEANSEYRQFYVAFNSAPIDHEQGILRLLRSISFADGTSSAMVYEVYPYDSDLEDN